METTSPMATVEALRSGLLEVLGACPADQCNPGDCPLYYLRELDYPQRLQWLNSLGQPDLEYLALYHHTCMMVKLQAVPTPAALQPTPPRSGG